jgi:hypothetical protein
LARCVGLAAIGAGAGWFAFNSTTAILGVSPSGTQRMLFGLALLAVTLAFGQIRTRLSMTALFFGWFVGASSSMPVIWAAFFAGSTVPGVLALLGWAALMAAPFALAPRGKPGIGVAVGLLAGAVPPLGIFGMASPLLTAGAVFPALGFLGLALVYLFLFLASLLPLAGAKTQRAGTVGLVIVLLFGAVRAVAYTLPDPPQSSIWALTSYYGPLPRTLPALFTRQDDLKSMVRQSILDGARLIVLPEGSDPQWDAGQAFYWSDVAALARRDHATVLLGAYINDDVMPQRNRDGLVDIATGKFYPAQIPMPIGMWHPWRLGSFPMRGATPGVPTVYGPALESICYEDLLLWPMAWQRALLALHGQRPALIVSAANQWFAEQGASVAQTRSIHMQARIWGLPLMRAVNWSAN